MRRALAIVTLIAASILSGCAPEPRLTPRPEPEWVFRFIDGTELRRPCRKVHLSDGLGESASVICWSRERDGMEWPAHALAFYAPASELGETQ